MVVMEPLILLEVDKTSLSLYCTLETPKSILVNEEVHLSVSGGVHSVSHENSRDNIVVPLLVEEVHLQLSVKREITCEVTHGVVGFEEVSEILRLSWFH
jgi:hypothetical protein